MRKVYTMREFSEACKFAAQVYKRQIDKDTAIVKLVGVGINETSANDFIVIYKI